MSSRMSILRCYWSLIHLPRPALSASFFFSPSLGPHLWSLARLHIGGGKAGGVRRGEEVAEALLGQVSVLVVVEGLSWQLAEEVGTVPGAAGAAASAQRTMGGRQRLRAAAAAYTTGCRKYKHSCQRYCQELRPKTKQWSNSNDKKAWCGLFLWHRAALFSKNYKNTSVSRTIVVADMFLHYNNHVLSSLFWVHPTHQIQMGVQGLWEALGWVFGRCPAKGGIN